MTKEDRETSDPMTIDEIETLLANATPGPWKRHRYLVYPAGGLCVDRRIAGCDTEEDAALIAAAPTALRYLLDRVREVERADYASIRFAMDQSAEHRADIAATVADRDEWKRRAEAAERERDEPRGFAVVSDADHPDTLRRRLADTEAKWKADVQRLIALVESLTKERDTLKRHYDSAAPEHNLAALLDLYDEQRRDAILALEAACEERDAAIRERDASADDAKLGSAVRGVLDMFMWDHSTVREEVESNRLAETVEGCLFVAIERAIRPADFNPRAHASQPQCPSCHGTRTVMDADHDSRVLTADDCPACSQPKGDGGSDV